MAAESRRFAIGPAPQSHTVLSLSLCIDDLKVGFHQDGRGSGLAAGRLDHHKANAVWMVQPGSSGERHARVLDGQGQVQIGCVALAHEQGVIRTSARVSFDPRDAQFDALVVVAGSAGPQMKGNYALE
mgnify:CR=1 FL=1